MADPVVFKFSALVIAIPFVIAAVGMIAAVIFLVTPKRVLAIPLFFIAALGGLVFGPAMLLDRVVVSAENIEQTTGFAWSQNAKGFRFADVSFVRITEKPTGPKRRLSIIWEIHQKDGTTRDIDPGDLWETNSDAIIPLLIKHGVEFRE